MAKLIGDWKKLNSGRKTVECVTCNSRHSPAGQDPYAGKLKVALKAGFLSSTRDITVKALPVAVGGSLNAHSILLAHAPNRSWCYISAPGPDDTTMMQASNEVKKIAKTMGDDVAQAGDALARSDKTRTYSLNYGYFNTLRAQLSPVH